MIKKTIISILIAFLTIPFINKAHVMAIEEPEYDIMKAANNFELRRYHPYLVAETFVDENFDEAGNEGFRRLFAYISGENRKKASISMTVPVAQEKNFEKITMTAPVNQQKEQGKWRVTFVMPSGYTLDTVPEPLDERITLRKVEGKLVAALKYSGTWSKKRYEEKKDTLKKLVQDQNLIPVGEPVFARYNAPFVPWFLRRNEVLIDVYKNDN
jgi:hypothetical protein